MSLNILDHVALAYQPVWGAQRQLAAVLSQAVRATDFTGRYGGEEFLVVLADTDAEGAQRRATGGDWFDFLRPLLRQPDGVLSRQEWLTALTRTPSLQTACQASASSMASTPGRGVGAAGLVRSGAWAGC